MAKLQNISLKKYRKFLIEAGCKCNRIAGGHEHYSKRDIARPLTLQNHVDPVPPFIIKQHLRYLGYTTSQFLDMIDLIK